jgi:hypothetical protein
MARRMGLSLEVRFSFLCVCCGSDNMFIFSAVDVVGCGIDFSQNRAFYTKNGTFLGAYPSHPP